MFELDKESLVTLKAYWDFVAMLICSGLWPLLSSLICADTFAKIVHKDTPQGRSPWNAHLHLALHWCYPAMPPLLPLADLLLQDHIICDSHC